MIESSIRLPCGAVIKNRLGKSPLSENMSTSDNYSSDRFVNLYRQWSQGGAGLIVTGNVMVHGKSLAEYRNVVVEKGHEGTESLRKWAQSGSENGGHIWMQINHPGRQSPKFLSPQPVAPSAVALQPPLNKMFNVPREISEAEIKDLIERFAYTAGVAKEAGFTGVQIHGGHGYLISQFLSPKDNLRTDQWGGSLENRMRFLLQVYQAVRARVGPDFPVGLKFNSADFQKGGLTEEDSMQVIRLMGEAGVDLIEITGGTFESLAMIGGHMKESTRKREAYFLDFCEKARRQTHTPLMLTGGFRSSGGMRSALESGACDMVGLGRPLILDPELPNKILRGETVIAQAPKLSTGIAAIDKLIPVELPWYTYQMHRMGRGGKPDLQASVVISVLKTVREYIWMGLRSLFLKG